jgi:hypothetical protein
VLLEARYDGAEAKRRLLLAESGTEEKKGGANALGPGPGGRPVRPWTVEECALFEDGLAQFGGKHFGLIRQHKVLLKNKIKF